MLFFAMDCIKPNDATVGGSREQGVREGWGGGGYLISSSFEYRGNFFFNFLNKPIYNNDTYAKGSVMFLEPLMYDGIVDATCNIHLAWNFPHLILFLDVVRCAVWGSLVSKP